MNLKVKKAIAMMAAAMMLMSATAAMAEEVTAVTTEAPIEDAQVFPFYGSYTGTVKEVADREDGSIFVTLESETNGPTNFVVTKDTYRVNDVEIKAGQTLIGFYESNRPMIMIYPPQYTISIVAEVKDNLFVEADKFDEDLVNVDNTLKLNISEDTEIVWENGTQITWIKAPTAEELAQAISNRKLVVLYDVTTRSIPAQTTPKKVIVLSKQEAEPVSDVSGFDVEANDVVLEEVKAFQAENGSVMVPVRVVAEALEFEVGWNGETKSVTVGENASFIIDNTTYRAWAEDVKLDSAPVLKDGVTYVPMEFFQKVLPLRTANVYEGRIVFEG